MARPTVTVTGARELRAALKRAGVSLQDLKDANAAVGRFIADRSRARAPRRTGALASAARPSKAAGRARVLVPKVYAGPIHWGWPAHHIEPQPWIQTTAEDTQGQWLGEYEEALDTIIRTIDRSTPR